MPDKKSSHPVHKQLQQNLFAVGNAEMYCDGASSGNPGDSGIGVVINVSHKDAGQSGKEESHCISEYIGTATNNVAEYSALLRGLEEAKSLGIRHIDIYMDYELIVKQIKGIYRVKNENLLPLWIKAKSLLKEFAHYSVTHVPREMNKEADSLATRAVKQKRAK